MLSEVSTLVGAVCAEGSFAHRVLKVYATFASVAALLAAGRPVSGVFALARFRPEHAWLSQSMRAYG